MSSFDSPSRALVHRSGSFAEDAASGGKDRLAGFGV